MTLGEINRHTNYDLRQMQSLPLDAKIVMTQERIRQWYDHWDGQVYVSFSGGKDSTVLKHIVDGLYDDVPAVFVNTGLEYPEIQNFVREVKDGKYECFNPDVEILRPEMRFDEVVKKYGYPVISKEVAKIIQYAKMGSQWALNILEGVGKNEKQVEYRKRFAKYRSLIEAPFAISSYCCDVMKKRPLKTIEKLTRRKPIVATMASESIRRTQAWEKTGCNAYDSKAPISKPMSFWTEQDVLLYIKQYNVPYCTIYGEICSKKNTNDNENGQNMLETTGCSRTGCMFCMFGCHLEKEPNRFQMMKITHPKQYAYCMKSVEEGGLGLDAVLNYLKIPH